MTTLLDGRNSVSVVGEFPGTAAFPEEVTQDVIDTFERLLGQGRNFTVVANPGGDFGAIVLKEAKNMGIRTLAIYETGDILISEKTWDDEIVIQGNGGAPTLMPECQFAVFGRMQELHPRTGVLLAYGGGGESVAEAWSGRYPVFFQDEFMSPRDKAAYTENLLKKTMVRRMEYAHCDGYLLGNDKGQHPWFFEMDLAPERRHMLESDDRHWFVKIVDALYLDPQQKWRGSFSVHE
ncbi:hypothetical protein [Pandoraea faecigallinarum]|uniref:hypothetical protein n=1 Tax=Pandoraea faecigallinarum TaxID=656179 RepID=UPI000A4A7F0B|nr:hypothetical protein [Pandoraea faecigallinarum]